MKMLRVELVIGVFFLLAAVMYILVTHDPLVATLLALVGLSGLII